MNRALRRRHGRLVLLLSAVAAAVLAASWAGRRPVPAAPLPAVEAAP